jgi:hypothetical protein
MHDLHSVGWSSGPGPGMPQAFTHIHGPLDVTRRQRRQFILQENAIFRRRQLHEDVAVGPCCSKMVA